MNKPNILLIMTDQQQARACRREGLPLDTTPCQDRSATCSVTCGPRATKPPP
jgi:hypothetical protein